MRLKQKLNNLSVFLQHQFFDAMMKENTCIPIYQL